MTVINRAKMLMFDVVKFHNRRNDLAEKHGEMPRNDRKTWIMLETVSYTHLTLPTKLSV